MHYFKPQKIVGIERQMNFNANKPIEFLLARGSLPILYWLKKDILEVPVDRERKNLKKYALRIRILENQKPNGGWCKKKYCGPPEWEKTYYIIDTLRNVFKLYHYGCTLEDEGIQKAIDFLFSTQTEEGDFRGAYLNEYAPTYHALTLELLCLFDLHKDKRTQKGFQWLIKNRQKDGGWVIPCRTIEKEELKKRYTPKAQLKLKPIKPDYTKKSSLLVTGMVLRALAACPQWRKSSEAWDAGEFLIRGFFKADGYDNRYNSMFWEEITYPFWATNILSSLDSVSKIGFSVENENIQNALKWVQGRQNSHGFWQAGFEKSTLEDQLWVTFAVLKMLKQFGLLEV